MNELAMQKLIVDDVLAHGGFAHKMSHRFNVGVADLLVKLPRRPAGVLEVKQRAAPKREDHTWKLDVTVLQQKYLTDAWEAGMPAGVASFIVLPGSGPKLKWLRMCVLSLRECVNRGWTARTSDHQPLNDCGIHEQLVYWLNMCEAEGR